MENVYYNLDTKNKNFKMISDRMKERGIKNNNFHLLLLDKDLKEVDPFDPKLSTAMKQKIIKECMINYWYFLRECIKVEREIGNNDLFSLNEGCLRLHFAMHNNLDIITDLYSADENICIRLLWEFLFGNTCFDISLMDKSIGDSKEALNEIRKVYDRLPEYLRYNSKDNINNEERFENNLNKNRITAKPGINTEVNAVNLGRGLTQPRQWYRNIGDINYIDVIFHRAIPVFSSAILDAEKNGKNSGIILTTHPYTSIDLDKIDSYEFELRHKELSAPCPSTLFDMSKKDIESYMEDYSMWNFIFISRYQD